MQTWVLRWFMKSNELVASRTGMQMKQLKLNCLHVATIYLDSL